jgi:methylmalonyl-CoA/ethylmalonyl-CoA epimerase
MPDNLTNFRGSFVTSFFGLTTTIVSLSFDHIGIVVRTLQAGREHLGSLIGISEWTTEFRDPRIKVCVQFGRDQSGICYELIAPFGEGSPISNALKDRVNILNHVAYLVSDLDAEAARLRAAGAVPTGPAQPAVAYGGKSVQFFYTPLRFIIELIEDPDHRHTYIAEVLSS